MKSITKLIVCASLFALISCGVEAQSETTVIATGTTFTPEVSVLGTVETVVETTTVVPTTTTVPESTTTKPKPTTTKPVTTKAPTTTQKETEQVKSSNNWDAVAKCESGGNWSTNTGNGFYGGLQFSLSSWRAVGGTGYPHQASKQEQINRAEKLLAIQGRGAWPHCGKLL